LSEKAISCGKFTAARAHSKDVSIRSVTVSLKAMTRSSVICSAPDSHEATKAGGKELLGKK
jgi:hypothetical protein